MAFIANAVVVKVSIGSAAGNRVARIIRQGEVLPDGVDDAIITRLLRRGLISELPSADELFEIVEAERAEQLAAEQALLDEQIQTAARKIVDEEFAPEFDKRVEEKAEQLLTARSEPTPAATTSTATPPASTAPPAAATRPPTKTAAAKTTSK